MVSLYKLKAQYRSEWPNGPKLPALRWKQFFILNFSLASQSLQFAKQMQMKSSLIFDQSNRCIETKITLNKMAAVFICAYQLLISRIINSEKQETAEDGMAKLQS